MKYNLLEVIIIIIFVMAIGIILGRSTAPENEQLQENYTHLKASYESLHKEALEMELYFEYLNDIDRLNKEIFKEGLYIDIDGTLHTYEIKTTEVVFEVDYIQFYEDVSEYLNLYERYNNQDFVIRFEQFLELESPGLIERIEYYDDIYYELRD